MSTQYLSSENLNQIFEDINYDLNLLYVIPFDYTKNLVLNHLRDKILILENALKANNSIIDTQPQPLPYLPEEYPSDQSSLPIQPTTPEGQLTFTLQELSSFDGKNGNPAYVAVDGTIYEVTNNAAWAAATHFGLAAGKDLTSEFDSCHAGQPVLNRLKVVGKLV